MAEILGAALITARKKPGVVVLADALRRTGRIVVSYGETAEVITEASIPVTSPQQFLGGISLEGFDTMSWRDQRKLLADKLGQCLSMAPEELRSRGLPVLDVAYVNLTPVEESHSVTGVNTDPGGLSLIQSALDGYRDILTDPEYIQGYVDDLLQGNPVNKYLLRGQAYMSLQRYDVSAQTAMTQVLARDR